MVLGYRSRWDVKRFAQKWSCHCTLSGTGFKSWRSPDEFNSHYGPQTCHSEAIAAEGFLAEGALNHDGQFLVSVSQFQNHGNVKLET
jgi:hypothetical protein